MAWTFWCLCDRSSGKCMTSQRFTWGNLKSPLRFQATVPYNCTLQLHLFPAGWEVYCLTDIATKHLPKSVSHSKCVLGTRCGSDCYICHIECSISASEVRAANTPTAHGTWDVVERERRCYRLAEGQTLARHYCSPEESQQLLLDTTQMWWCIRVLVAWQVCNEG